MTGSGEAAETQALQQKLAGAVKSDEWKDTPHEGTIARTISQILYEPLIGNKNIFSFCTLYLFNLVYWVGFGAVMRFKTH